MTFQFEQTSHSDEILFFSPLRSCKKINRDETEPQRVTMYKINND